ncbi:hypothetical protein IC793_13095 [Acinetobacter seifertii]|nr:hypothetical protein [Acinetobacter seifertii]QNX17661.1 hypothetical protein IC793_13095 [Acinetobacter seifertii]
MVEQNKTPETGNEQFWQGLSRKSGYIQQEFIQSSEFLSLALGESEYGVAKHAPLEKKIKLNMLMYLVIFQSKHYLNRQGF